MQTVLRAHNLIREKWLTPPLRVSTKKWETGELKAAWLDPEQNGEYMIGLTRWLFWTAMRHCNSKPPLLARARTSPFTVAHADKKKYFRACRFNKCAPCLCGLD